jgi:acetylglutamate kinase
MEDIIVVKIGGATLGSHDTTLEDLVQLQKQGRPAVVVHGGGKTITEWLDRMKIATQFVRGERVTDGASLDVVVAVLAGLVNKKIVADIQSLGGRAIGICGADGGIIKGKVKGGGLGFVCEIEAVDAKAIKTLLAAGFLPVIAPICLRSDKIGQGEPKVLNVNADAIAGEVAREVGATELIFLTDIVGVCDQAGHLLTSLTPDEAVNLVASGVAKGGMIPKINACVSALDRTRLTRIIDGRQPHALINEIEGKGSGTTIKRLT